MLSLDACRQNLGEREGDLKAFLHISAATPGSGQGSLSGMAVAIKDNLCIQGWPTTAGSRILHNFVPP